MDICFFIYVFIYLVSPFQVQTILSSYFLPFSHFFLLPNRTPLSFCLNFLSSPPYSFLFFYIISPLIFFCYCCDFFISSSLPPSSLSVHLFLLYLIFLHHHHHLPPSSFIQNMTRKFVRSRSESVNDEI